MGFEYFDMSSYQKDGFLSEKDYNVLSRKIVKAINPVRIGNIRKDLEFKPMTYLEYTKEELLESLQEGEFSTSLELNCISIPLLVSFNATYFPDFVLEYTNPLENMAFIDHVVFLKEIQGVALKQVPNQNFHSLAIAAYNLEKSIKESFKKSRLWKISEDISTIIEFFIPMNIDQNFDVTAKLIFTFYMN